MKKCIEHLLDPKIYINEEQQQLYNEILEKDYYEDLKSEFKNFYLMNIVKNSKEQKEFKSHFCEKLNLIFCPGSFCKNKKLKRYNYLLEMVDKKTVDYLNYVNTIYHIEELNLIKKIFFNKEQNLILEYIKKPVLEFTIQQEMDYLDGENKISIKKSEKPENISTNTIERNLFGTYSHEYIINRYKIYPNIYIKSDTINVHRFFTGLVKDIFF